MHFDALYCNLVEAGEAGGILEALLDRLAIYQEKTMAIKSKIKSALMYPVAVIVVAFVVLTVIMIFVIPAFKEVFSSFGADLPAPTLFVIAVSEFFVTWWWAIFGLLGGGIYFFLETWKRSEKMQMAMDRLLLKMPVFGDLVHKSVHRTLDAHACRRCSPPACRWSRRSTRSAAPRAMPSTRRPPSRSSATSPPARH